MAEPTYSFTIPSVEDDTTLECRIYYPKDLNPFLRRGNQGVKGAVFAHPYAPLGGCYDDPAVLAVAETLVEEGWVVGTFNFRGAGGSQGSTSWTGRGEIEDYVSCVGFMVYHLRHLLQSTIEHSEVLSPIVSADPRNTAAIVTSNNVQQSIRLVLGGYSYGSLILARLPAIPILLKRFESAVLGSAPSEILLRARTLAQSTLDSFLQDIKASSLPLDGAASLSPTKRSKVSPTTVGGDETDASERRRSRDSKRSIDIVRKSVEIPRRIKAHVRHVSGSGKRHGHTAAESAHRVPPTPSGGEPAPTVEVSYLLLSPVILPFTTLICPPGPPFPQLNWKASADSTAGEQFLLHPTLTIAGTQDAFTSRRRLRAWYERQFAYAMSRGQHATPTASFECEQIEGADHFWREDGVMQKLSDRVARWVANSTRQ